MYTYSHVTHRQTELNVKTVTLVLATDQGGQSRQHHKKRGSDAIKVKIPGPRAKKRNAIITEYIYT